ncbi:MAG: hypothetical protein CMI12_01150 [Oceanospirillum sp.]|nr:hypothetical protein [Oceanospirillum sp.]
MIWAELAFFYEISGLSVLTAPIAWSDHNGLKARNGVLDLQYWPFDSDELFTIRGEWLFYPQQLLLLKDLSSLPIPSSQFLPQRLLECSQIALQKKDACYATYVLELRHLPDQPLAIFIPEMATAFKLFWNHQLIASGGQVSQNKDQFIPYVGHRLAYLPKQHRRGVLILQLANLVTAEPAPPRSLMLGDTETVQEYFATGELQQALAGALTAIASILFFLQFLVRHRYERGVWALSLFSLAVTLYIYSESYTVMRWFILQEQWGWAFRVNCMAQSLLVPCFIFWLQGYLNVVLPGWVRRVMWWQLYLSPLLLLVPQAVVVWLEAPLMFWHLILLMTATLYLMKYRVQSWRVLLPQITAIGLCLLAIIHDALLYQQWIGGIYWLPMGLLCFIIIQIFLLAVSRTRQYAYLERLNKNLATERDKLQDKVEQISQEIVAKVDELDTIQDELRYLQRFDEHTGLLRHATFQKECQHRVQSMVLSEQPVALILLDIDRFKQISAQYGFFAADQVMKDVALLLEQWCQKENWVCRMEGESFALFALDMSEDQALLEAESLRLRIQQRAVILHNHNEQDLSFHVTVSFGLSSCQADEASIERLTKEADLALNKAKSQGRNCVVSYSQMLEQANFKRFVDNKG